MPLPSRRNPFAVPTFDEVRDAAGPHPVNSPRQEAEAALRAALAAYVAAAGHDRAVSLLKTELIAMGETREALARLAPEAERGGRHHGQYRLFG